MLKMTVKDIVRITKGKLVGPSHSKSIKDISIDTRTLKSGSCYVAIKGVRLDGHRFISSAVRKGASLVILSKKTETPKNFTAVYVKDTVKALGDIARAYREQFDIPLWVVVGSAGKTTTKDLTAKVLAKKYKVLKNHRSENNHIGVPLTLLKIRRQHEIAVLEIGTNQPGDIRCLSSICRPTGCIFTNIGSSHLERLGSVSGVFREKTSVLKFLPARAPVIYNADDPYLRKIKSMRKNCRFISYAIDSKAKFRADVDPKLRSNKKIFSVNERHRFRIKSPVHENVYNAIAAISCGRTVGIRYNDIIDAVAAAPLPKGRQRVLRFGKTIVIDDSYNANPVSFESAIKTLQQIRHNGRKIVVCADMLELGQKKEALHKSTGRMISRSGVDYVLATGDLGRFICRESGHNGTDVKALHFKQLGRLHGRLRMIIRPGDAVLVKASRSMHLERTVDYLRRLLSKR